MHCLLRREKLCDGPELCEGSLDDETPCESCVVEMMERALRTSRAGELLRAGLELDFARQAGIAIEQVTCEEFSVLKTITSERNAWQEEVREAARRESEQQARRR